MVGRKLLLHFLHFHHPWWSCGVSPCESRSLSSTYKKTLIALLSGFLLCTTVLSHQKKEKSPPGKGHKEKHLIPSSFPRSRECCEIPKTSLPCSAWEFIPLEIQGVSRRISPVEAWETRLSQHPLQRGNAYQAIHK